MPARAIATPARGADEPRETRHSGPSFGKPGTLWTISWVSYAPTPGKKPTRIPPEAGRSGGAHRHRRRSRRAHRGALHGGGVSASDERLRCLVPLRLVRAEA